MKARKRKGRSVRTEGLQLDITTRDLEVVECILRLGGHVSATLLLVHFWNSTKSDAGSRRLRRLYDEAILTRYVTAFNAPIVYGVSKAGRELLAMHTNVDGISAPERLVALVALRHTTLCQAARLWLAAMSDAEIGRLLQWSGGRSNVAVALGLPEAHLVPDGIAHLELTDGQGSTSREVVAFIEADIGTETDSLRQKLMKWSAYLGEQPEGSAELWLFVAGADARRDRVATWCAPVARWARFIPESTLLQRPALPPPRTGHFGAASSLKRVGPSDV